MQSRLIPLDDLTAFHALWIKAVTEYPLSFLMTAAEVAALSNSQLTTTLDRGGWIGLYQDDLIGFACVALQPLARTNHRATVGPFFVDPAHHGSGAADALMQACLSHAQSNGAWMIELYVAANNPRAIRFYERHGFAYEGRMPAAVVVDGQPHDDFYYCLELPH